MSLSAELISQFAKVTNDKPVAKKDSIVYGTVVTDEGITKVHIDGAYREDGSPIYIPLSSTVSIDEGNRVIVSIRNHMAVVTGNLSTPSTTEEHVNHIKTTIVDTITADAAEIKTLEAAEAAIDILRSNDVTIAGSLDAHAASIASLQVDHAKLNQLDAHYAEFDTLKTDYATLKNATVKDLTADVAELEKLIFGSASGSVIQTQFANAVIAKVGNAQIKSAMIDDIDTNKVQIKSADGHLVISDETIQISDSNRVRVQIGKDASNDYSINVWDNAGNLMFSKGGITASAIKSAIIRDDMVAPNANIAAGKVYISDASKTLDVVLREMTSTVSDMGETIVSQGATISAITTAIQTAVWEQSINTASDEMETKYSQLQQTVDGIHTTVTSHTAQLTENSEELTVVQSTIGQLVDSISMLVTDGNGTSLMTQTENGWTFSTSDIQSAVNRTSEALAELTSQCGNTDAAVEVLQQSVSDLGIMAEYIRIGTHEGEPCIELGEGDSNFKLLITNTRILFMDGSDVPAYINNKSLYIKKAVIEEELHQGGYAWVTRSNGHLSLVWKGAAN